MSLTSLSAQLLRSAAGLKEQIEALEQELNQLLGGQGPAPAANEAAAVSATAPVPMDGRRQVSAESRARMAAAQKARWAARRGANPPGVPEPALKEPKRMISAAHRKALSLAQKARWAARRGRLQSVATPDAPMAQPRKKRTMTDAWRMALARAHEARRAKAKAAKKARA